MLGGTAADELVGREKELDLLDRELDALGGGSAARTVEVVGEPGIGKTHLLRSVRSSARRRGHLVLAGRATEFEQPIPFAAIVDALDDHLAELPPDELAGLGADRLSLLAAVFPAVAVSTPAPAGNELITERYRMHRAIRALLEQLAADHGLVLTLDDVHWADPASIELLEHLRRHPPRAPLLLVTAYRPSQVPARLVASMAGENAGLTRLELGPLSVTDVSQLLGPDVSPARGRVLHRESGGNPFYLHALRSAPADPLTGMPAVSGASRQVISAELSALSPAQALVAYAAAVAGDPVDPQLVAVVTELSQAEAMEVLDQLLARDLLRVTEDGRRMQFRHPLVRHVAYVCAPASWRLGAHRRAASALAARPGDTAALLRAQHLVRSADPGDTETVEVLRWAAKHTGAYAPAAAAHFLAAALRLTPDAPGAAAERRELSIDLATALTADGRFDEARGLIGDVLRWLPTGHSEQRVRAVLLAAQIERLLGRNEVARLLLTGELSRLAAGVRVPGEPAGPAEIATAELKLELARSAVDGVITSRDRPLLAEIAGFARAHGLASLEAAAVGVHAVAANAVGDRLEGRRLTDLATELVDALPDEELARHPHAASRVAAGELDLGRLTAAVTHAERGLAVARRSGRSYLVIQMGVTLTVAYRLLGRLPEALACTEDMVDAAELTGSHYLRGIAHCLHAGVNAVLGVAPDRRALAEHARMVMASPSWWSRAALILAAEAMLVDGSDTGADECRRIMMSGHDESTLHALLPRPFGYRLLVRAELRRDDPEAAARWAELAESTTDPALPGQVGMARLARANVLLSAGDATDAATLAGEAAVLFREAGMRHEASRSLLIEADSLLAAGDQPAARVRLEEAAELLHSCGARKLHGITVRKLRRIGRQRRVTDLPRGTAPDQPAETLTTRETEIARLIGAGLTNQQIADRLVVSVRTVTTHVSNIFRKLNVTSRAELVAHLTD
ncbi:helix-turn-helix transcriptional regulator [Fodinicola acaciae]|uniref:helix-turn-helix transcriptional regulator n=1 Tax=Fodinicola acaciae TaxID=2681555 RepID=UPI0013D67895|nr:AAA family ATPase [Fodinicola acaciae]